MTALLADRVMKARRHSTCPVCRDPIRVGQQIAKCGTWQHIEHVIEPDRQLDQLMRQPGTLVALPPATPLHKMMGERDDAKDGGIAKDGGSAGDGAKADGQDGNGHGRT